MATKKPVKRVKKVEVRVSLRKMLDRATDSSDMHKITKVVRMLSKGKKAKRGK